jgi:hypothetical protein
MSGCFARTVPMECCSYKRFKGDFEKWLAAIGHKDVGNLLQPEWLGLVFNYKKIFNLIVRLFHALDEHGVWAKK